MTPTNEEDRKTLILTGASRGIGHATVKRFSSAGWRVLTCSRQAFPEDCPWEAGPEDHIQVDLSDVDDTLRAIGEMRERLEVNGSRLSALVNNAAISPKLDGGGRMGTLDTSRDDWGTVFQVNFFAPIMLARGLIDELKVATGSVVNVSSIVGIRVNAISPGEIETSILSPGTEKIVAEIPMRRLGQPEEVAKAIYFLCTEQSSYITGEELHINGGQHV